MDNEQCKDCLYWQSLSGYQNRDHGCLHILYTGKMKKKKNGVCLSKEPVPIIESSKQNKKTKNMVY